MSITQTESVTRSPLAARGAIAWPWLAALIAWTLFLSCYDLGGGAAFEQTDCWVAQTAREMQASGRWLVPQFSGEIRLHKSPGAYWAVMLASKLLGGPVDEVAARLPNALAVVMLVAAVFLFTRSLAGDRAAIFAGFAASSSVLCLYGSHKAASDVGLTALCTVALMCWWVAANSDPSWPWRGALWCMAYLAAGLGMLHKLPMPIIHVALPVACYVVLRRRWSVLASWWHVLGIVLFLLPWVPWVAAILKTEPQAIVRWRTETLDRFTGDLPLAQEQAHWQYYLLYLVPPLFWTVPYTLSLPGAFRRAFTAGESRLRDGLQFMVICFVSQLAFLTLSVGKESRYLMPAIPPLFVLLGCELARFFHTESDVPSRRVRWSVRAVWVFVPMVLLAGLLALRKWAKADQVYSFAQVWPAYLVAVAIFAAGACTAAWLYQRRSGNASFAVLVMTMWAMWLWMWPRLLPMMANQAPSIDAARQIVTRLPADMQAKLKFVGSQDAQLIWYGNLRIPRVLQFMDQVAKEGGKRSQAAEERAVAEAMIRDLASSEPVLLVSPRFYYVRFLREAPAALAAQGQAMPRTYVWLESSVGAKAKRTVVFGNQPPPWPEPEVFTGPAQTNGANPKDVQPGT